MKRNLFYLLIIFYAPILKGQTYNYSFSDEVINPGNNGLKSGVDYSLYIPNTNTPMKYVRVNFHFMQKSDGSGNFTETSDGLTSNSIYTGYYYAKKIVELANYRLTQNLKSALPPSNVTPVLQPKYSFVLDGVYFHKDNANYMYYNNAPALYSINKDNVINVFCEGYNAGSISGGGHANMNSPCYIEFNDCWDSYRQCILNPPYPGVLGDNLWVHAGLLMHESGHNLGLYHTLLNGNGTCNLNAEDYCSDTPTGQEMMTKYGAPQMCCTINGVSKACCGWVQTGTYCSNNMMDYSGITAITPEQLGRVHYALSSYMLGYNVCKTLANDLNVTTFSDNQILFSGKNVKIPSSSGTSMVVKSGHSKSIVISNTLLLNSGFEVQLGGELDISIQSNCP